MSIRQELEAVGVSADDAAVLEARVASAASGVLDAEDGKDLVRPRIALVGAVVASLETRRFASALETLLDYLGGVEAELSTYDAARYRHILGLAAWRLDDSAFAASRALNDSLRLLDADGGPAARRYTARVYDAFGQLLHQQGRLGEARRELETALHIRDASGDDAGTATTLGSLARLCMDLGDFAAAANHFERNLAILAKLAPEDAPARTRAQIVSHLSRCKLALGQIDEADRLIAEGDALARAEGDAAGEVFASVGRGYVHFHRGDAEKARAAAEAALARIEPLDVMPSFRTQLVAAARRLSADARAKLGDHAGAVTDYRAARKALGEVVGASPIEHAEVRRGLGDSLAALNEASEAAQTLRLALAYLEGTAADALRLAIEETLKQRAYDSWLLYSAGRFIGQQRIEFLLSEGRQEGFRGTRRHVATLFADIRGFTTMSESLAPEELISVLNDFLAQLTLCVQREGGMVDKFIGDAVMATFPVAKDSQEATRGLLAALAMRDELERFNRRVLGMQPLSVGVGLHAGDVVAGLVGSPQKREYTIIGDVVNTAARLEALTKPLGATILVTEAVVRHADAERFWLRPLGAYLPGGRKTPVRIFDVMGERDRSPEGVKLGEEIARVESAFAALKSRDFDGAAGTFSALAGETDDTPRAISYALLEAKARELAAKPPGEDWTGDVVLAEG